MQHHEPSSEEPMECTVLPLRILPLLMRDAPPTDEQIERARRGADRIPDVLAAGFGRWALRNHHPVRRDGRPSEWYRLAGALWAGRRPCDAAMALDALMDEARQRGLPQEHFLVGMLCGLGDASMSHYRAVLRCLIRLPHNRLASPPVERSAIPWLINHFERFAPRVAPDVRAAVFSRMHHLDLDDHLRACLAFAAPSGAACKKDLLAPPNANGRAVRRWRDILARALPRLGHGRARPMRCATLRLREDALFENPKRKADLPLVHELETSLNQLLKSPHAQSPSDMQLRALSLVSEHLSPSDMARIETHFLVHGQHACLRALAAGLVDAVPQLHRPCSARTSSLAS